MAQIKKARDDYFIASFGEVGQAKPGVNALEVGAVSVGGAKFERLPIGTSSAGTAVLVDLVAAEVVSITNLAAGTITRVEGGTIGNLASGSVVVTAGTITAGTVDSVQLPHSDNFGSIVAIAGTATGTIYPAVSGSAIYITDLIVASEGAGTVVIGDGTPTVKRAEFKFGAQGNAVVSGMSTPIKTTAGSALVFSTGGGTVVVTANGYID